MADDAGRSEEDCQLVVGGVEEQREDGQKVRRKKERERMMGSNGG